MEPTSLSHLLAVIWFMIVGLFLVFYVVLDGFDLGVGLLSLVAGREDRRAVMMTSLSAIWDANESWLVVVGGILFGAFPKAYAMVLSALYIPIIVMLFGLILRGVAFEFHELSERPYGWGLAFGIGSFVAAAAQGFALGALLSMGTSGAPVTGTWAWFTPYSCLVAVGVVCGYALLGATYLIMKTEGIMQAPCHPRATIAAVLVLLVAAAVTVYTPLQYSWVAAKWFSRLGIYYYAGPVVLALFSFGMLFRSLRRRAEVAPFVWSLLIFVSSFAGLAATLFPYIIPGQLTVYQAAADPTTLVFMLSMVGLFIPIMIAYNAYQYTVFRGKIRVGEGYGGGR